MKKIFSSALAFAFLFIITTTQAQETEEKIIAVPPAEVSTEVTDVTDELKDAMEKRMMAKKLMIKEDWKDKKEWHKGKWNKHGKDKSLGKMILYKSIFAAFALVFLFLAAFSVRKGWELGGKKK